MLILTWVAVTGMYATGAKALRPFFAEQHPALAAQTLSAPAVAELQGTVESGRNADLRWSDFTPYKTEVAKLYGTNGYSLVWVQSLLEAALLVSSHQRWQIPDARIGEHLVAQLVH